MIVAPIPISSEAIGTGLVPVAAYIFFPSSTDRVSQPSVLAVAGICTTTKTDSQTGGSWSMGVAELF
jgi:hypothetical protein